MPRGGKSHKEPEHLKRGKEAAYQKSKEKKSDVFMKLARSLLNFREGEKYELRGRYNKALECYKRAKEKTDLEPITAHDLNSMDIEMGSHGPADWLREIKKQLELIESEVDEDGNERVSQLDNKIDEMRAKTHKTKDSFV